MVRSRNYITFILLLNGLLVDGQFQCPVAGDRCIDGNYPDPSYCSYYYSCYANLLGGCHRQRIRCPNDYIFDWNLRECASFLDAECDVSTVSAVYAARITEHPGNASGPLPFDLGNENLDGQMWDSSTHSFNMRAAQSFYYITMNAATRAGHRLDYRLMRNEQSIAGCNKAYSIADAPGDIVSRDLILDLLSDDTLSIRSTTGVYSTPEPDTGIGIFDLASVMSIPLIAFSVARDTYIIGESDPVPFNTELVNIDDHYQTNTHRFIAPSPGIYFFSISVGLFPWLTTNVQLYVQDEPLIDINRQSTHHDDEDTIGRSIMLQLSQNDAVHVVNNADGAAFSSDLLEMSFSGFKYEPPFYNAMVAWSLARTFPASGNLERVSFDRILVNAGLEELPPPWKPESNQIEVPQSGTYFIHLSVGLHPNQAITYGLRKNTIYQFFAARRTVKHNDQDVVARSAIRKYTPNDILTVGTDNNARIYSDAQMQTTFIGFLLYEDE